MINIPKNIHNINQEDSQKNKVHNGSNRDGDEALTESKYMNFSDIIGLYISEVKSSMTAAALSKDGNSQSQGAATIISSMATQQASERQSKDIGRIDNNIRQNAMYNFIGKSTLTRTDSVTNDSINMNGELEIPYSLTNKDITKTRINVVDQTTNKKEVIMLDRNDEPISMHKIKLSDEQRFALNNNKLSITIEGLNKDGKTIEQGFLLRHHKIIAYDKKTDSFLLANGEIINSSELQPYYHDIDEKYFRSILGGQHAGNTALGNIYENTNHIRDYSASIYQQMAKNMQEVNVNNINAKTIDAATNINVTPPVVETA